MPAHLRSVLTGGSLTVPISDSRLVLGIWQGIYLWEHRIKPHERQVVITISENSASGSPPRHINRAVRIDFA